jgi:hypothetical protein
MIDTNNAKTQTTIKNAGNLDRLVAITRSPPVVTNPNPSHKLQAAWAKQLDVFNFLIRIDRARRTHWNHARMAQLLQANLNNCFLAAADSSHDLTTTQASNYPNVYTKFHSQLTPLG